MRMKVFDKMRWTKQDKMRKDKHFGKLQKFTKFDKGGRGINDNELKESVFSDSKQLFIEDKELLLMGGAYGHLAHPFDVAFVGIDIPLRASQILVVYQSYCRVYNHAFYRITKFSPIGARLHFAPAIFRSSAYIDRNRRPTL